MLRHYVRFASAKCHGARGFVVIFEADRRGFGLKIDSFDETHRLLVFTAVSLTSPHRNYMTERRVWTKSFRLPIF